MIDQSESLDPELQRIVAEARRSVDLGAGARDRLREALRAEPIPQRPSRIAWLLEPRRLVLPPLATAALAAGLVGIGVFSGLQINRDGPSAEQPPAVVAGTPRLPDSLAPRAVKFVFIAPSAASVSVVGDFNDWNTSATPMQSQGADGTWTVYVPMNPGLHTYSFLLDGKHFVPDPTAPMAPDDGFGSRNSVVFVGGSSL